MKARSSICTVIALLANIGCQSPGADAPAAVDSSTVARDKAAIDSIRTHYQATWRSGDAVQLAAFYAADGLVLYPNQPAVVGRDAIRSHFQAFFAEFVQEQFELTSEEIQVARPWAFDRGTVRWRGLPRRGGDPVEDRGKYLVVLQWQPDGSWKVARDMDNSDQPAR